MGMKQDSEGRVVIDCTTLLPKSAAFPTEMVKIGGERVEEPREVVKEEEALVAALDVRVLHRRVGHLGNGGDGEVGSGGAGQGAGGWASWGDGDVRGL